MEISTHEAVNLTQINTTDISSTIPTKVNESYDVIRIANINKRDVKEVKQNDSILASNKNKCIVVLIIMMVILLLVTIASIALSVVTYSQSSSEHSKVLSQLDKTNNDMTAVLTQLARISSFSPSVQSPVNNMLTQPNCGPGLWWRVAYLNMTDPSEQCPPAWREYSTSGVRACGRPVSSGGSCAAIVYFIGHQYSRVCGRVIGYQFRTPDAFSRYARNDIDFDGINITYGAQHHHIWSYVAGVTKNTASVSRAKCPCSSTNSTNGQKSEPPLSIGNNYYCESGNSNARAMNNHLYSNDPLWDGLDCVGTCCNGTNSPPWFSVQLPTPTTDTIQVSICCDQHTDDEDTPVELLEIYVQ